MIGTRIHKVILALLLCAASAGAAEFKVAKLFQDHMVLQRGKPIKIWGWTDVGGRVSVAFAGQTKTVEAGKDGKWMVTLDPIPASSTGRTMKLASSAGRQTVEIKDVLVG